MKLTTLERVKLRLSKTDDQDDTVLDHLISSVSARAERAMNGLVELAERTEYQTLRPCQRIYRPKALTIVSVSAIYYDVDRVYAASSLLASQDYSIDTDSQTIQLEFDPPDDREYPRALKIVYTGGLASTVVGLIDEGYGDLVDGITQQVCFEFQRTRNLHLDSESQGDHSASLTTMGWLKHVSETLDAMRLGGFS